MRKNWISFLTTLLLVLSFSAQNAHAKQDNFASVLKRIQDTHWKGYFIVEPNDESPVDLSFLDPFDIFKKIKAGLDEKFACAGPIDVYFFPMQVEEFSKGIATVSYRHHADFSNTGILCQVFAGTKSPVDVGSCDPYFPKKYNPRERAAVPFRTIIPRNGGRTAVISSPSCESGQVERKELKLDKLQLSPDGRKLTVTIKLIIPGKGEVSHFSYVLGRTR